MRDNLPKMSSDIELLKADSRNRNAFVLLVARIASVIDEVDTKNIRNHVNTPLDNSREDWGKAAESYVAKFIDCLKSISSALS